MAEINELFVKISVDDSELKDLDLKVSVDDTELAEFERNRIKQVRRTVKVGNNEIPTFSFSPNQTENLIEQAEKAKQEIEVAEAGFGKVLFAIANLVLLAKAINDEIIKSIPFVKDLFDEPTLQEIIDTDIRGLPPNLQEIAKRRQEVARQQLEEIQKNLPSVEKFLKANEDNFQFNFITEEQLQLLEKGNDLTEEQIEQIKDGNKVIDENSGSLLQNEKAHSIAIAARKQFNKEATDGHAIAELTIEDLLSTENKLAMVGDRFIAVSKDQSSFQNEANNTAEALEKQANEVNNVDSSIQGLVSQNAQVINSEQQVVKAVDDASASMDNGAESAEGFSDKLEQVENSGGFFQGIKDGFVEFAQSVESNSELIADFFANTLSQMSQNFSDLFFNVVKGRFDNLADLAKQAFDAILKSFLDLVAAIVTRELVIKITGVFDSKGGIGSDPIGSIIGGVGDFLGGIFGGGGGSNTSSNPVGGSNGFIPPGGTTSDFFTTSLPGTSGSNFSSAANLGLTQDQASSFIDSNFAPSDFQPVNSGGFNFFSTQNFGSGVTKFLTLGAPFIGAALGFLADGAKGALKGGVAGLGALAGSFVGGPIGAAVGGILSSVIFDGIAGLFKKKPRLDLDFDTIRDEFGETTGEAAKVLDFLNEDLFNDRIFSRSVSRKAGLGLGDQLPDVIREAIEGQINAIQDIINQLPGDIASQLNESLLNTSVDIESEVRGDRLLEFDEKGKNIAEEFQNLEGREAEVVSLEEVRKEKSNSITCSEEEYRLAA